MSESSIAPCLPLLPHALWPGHQPLPRGLILGALSWRGLVRLTPQDAHWLMSVHTSGVAVIRKAWEVLSREYRHPHPSPARSSLQGMVRGALVRGGLSQGEAWADWGTYSR